MLKKFEYSFFFAEKNYQIPGKVRQLTNYPYFDVINMIL